MTQKNANNTYSVTDGIFEALVLIIASYFLGGMLSALIPSPWGLEFDAPWFFFLGASTLLAAKFVIRYIETLNINEKTMKTMAEIDQTIPDQIREFHADTPIDFCAVAAAFSVYYRFRMFRDPVMEEYENIEMEIDKEENIVIVPTGSLLNMFGRKFGRMPFGITVKSTWMAFLIFEVASAKKCKANEVEYKDMLALMSPSVSKLFKETLGLK